MRSSRTLIGAFTRPCHTRWLTPRNAQSLPTPPRRNIAAVFVVLLLATESAISAGTSAKGNASATGHHITIRLVEIHRSAVNKNGDTSIQQPQLTTFIMGQGESVHGAEDGTQVVDNTDFTLHQWVGADSSRMIIASMVFTFLAVVCFCFCGCYCCRSPIANLFRGKGRFANRVRNNNRTYNGSPEAPPFQQGMVHFGHPYGGTLPHSHHLHPGGILAHSAPMMTPTPPAYHTAPAAAPATAPDPPVPAVPMPLPSRIPKPRNLEL